MTAVEPGTTAEITAVAPAGLDGRPPSALPTAVPATPGRLRAHLDPSWRAWSGVHGGVVAGLLLTAASQQRPGHRPRALTVQFLAPAVPGDVALTALVQRESSSSCTTTAKLLLSDGRTAVQAVLSSGRARRGAAAGHVPPPDALEPDLCPVLPVPVEFLPFSQHLEFRLASPVAPLQGADVPQLVCWIRFRAGGTLDAAALAVLADAMPPALYAVLTAPVAVPTVELQLVYPAGEPVTGWVLCRITTRTSGDGWCVDDSESWAPDGRLLVMARQTRRVLLGPS